MQEETKKRLDGMTREEQERRLAELNRKLGITEPVEISHGAAPPMGDLEEMEEREYLKKLLGYSGSQ